MKVVDEFILTPKELLTRLGLSPYQVKTSKITKVTFEGANVRVVTSRIVKCQPPKVKEVQIQP